MTPIRSSINTGAVRAACGATDAAIAPLEGMSSDTMGDDAVQALRLVGPAQAVDRLGAAMAAVEAFFGHHQVEGIAARVGNVLARVQELCLTYETADDQMSHVMWQGQLQTQQTGLGRSLLSDVTRQGQSLTQRTDLERSLL